MRHVLVVVLALLWAVMGWAQYGTGGGTAAEGGISLYFYGHLTGQGSCERESATVLRCRIPAGTEGKVELEARVEPPHHPVTISGISLPPWLDFEEVSGTGTVETTCPFVVPRDVVGRRFTLKFRASTVRGAQVTLIIYVEVVAPEVPTEPTPSVEGPPVSIPATTDEEGKFSVSYPGFPGTVFTGKLRECGAGPLSQQPFVLALLPKGTGLTSPADVGKVVISVPGYEPVEISQFRTFSLFFMTTIDVGEICLTRKCSSCTIGYEFREHSLPGLTPTRWVQDFKLPCCCECLVTITGPDEIRMGYDKEATYTVNRSVDCTGYEPGGWVMYGGQRGEVVWRISEPAEVSGDYRFATVRVPPPSRANERIRVNLEVEWEGIGICLVYAGENVIRYNACAVKCKATKEILLTSECVDLAREIERLKGEIPKKEEEKRVLEERIKALEGKLREGLEKREETIQRLEKSLKDLLPEQEKAADELEDAEKGYESAEKEYQRLKNLVAGLERSLSTAWNLYRRLPLAARCLQYKGFQSAHKWDTKRQVRFVRDILGVQTAEHDPFLPVYVEEAIKKCTKEVVLPLAGALVDLGSIASLIGSGPIDAATSQAIGEIVSRYLEEEGVKREELTERKIPIGKMIELLKGLIARLERELTAAKDELRAAYGRLGKARKAYHQAKSRFEGVREQVERIRAKLEAAKKGKEAFEKALREELTELRRILDVRSREIEQLRRRLRELEKEYAEACK